MPHPTPAKESIALYNKLLSLPFSARDEIGAIEWQLRKIHLKSSSDTEASVALMHAFCMTGKALEATSLANEIWSQRLWLFPDVRLTYLQNVVEIGMFERAISLADEIDGGWRKDIDLIGAVLQAAQGIGSIRILKEVASAIEALDGPTAPLNSFLDQLEILGLTSHFARHQMIIYSVMQDRFSGYRTYIADGGEDQGIELVTNIFVDADRKERRLMETAIDDALTEYYISQKVDPYLHANIITTSVYDIASRWAFIRD